MDDVLIVGAGIGGLTLALCLDRVGIGCRIYEGEPELAAIGAGINILPHASAVLGELGLEQALTDVAVETRESAFFNRFGQLIYREAAGRAAGAATPQYSIHRGDLQALLLAAVRERLGADTVRTGWRLNGFIQDARSVTGHFVAPSGERLVSQRGSVLVGCDGVHSAVRRVLYPDESEPRYSGYNMWRGVTVSPPILSGATMTRVGWLRTGKLVVYPIRNNVNAAGDQLLNWVAEVETPLHTVRSWNRHGRLADFLEPFASWRFDWLDVPAMLERTETILEYPMVDQDPLPRWTFGRVTLLGDAAHPMLPRGSNGGAQAIGDAKVLAQQLQTMAAERAADALLRYEERRRPATARVVLANRTNPPDSVLRVVYERTGDRPFDDLEAVLSAAEASAMLDRYRELAGFDL